MVKRAEKQGDKCEDKECKFTCNGKSLYCCYGMRNQAGCYMQDKKTHEKMMDSHASMILLKAQAEYNPDITEEEKDAIKLVDKIINKPFRFVFKGHEYTVSDSARNQGECPHCGCQSPNHCWSKDDECYIGKIRVDNEMCYCFECPKCFEKFFYHSAEEVK